MNLNETINNILPSDLKAKLKSAFMQFGAEPEVAKAEEPIKMAEIKYKFPKAMGACADKLF